MNMSLSHPERVRRVHYSEEKRVTLQIVIIYSTAAHFRKEITGKKLFNMTKVCAG